MMLATSSWLIIIVCLISSGLRVLCSDILRSTRLTFIYIYVGLAQWRSTVVERRSLAGELSLSCARPAADG